MRKIVIIVFLMLSVAISANANLPVGIAKGFKGGNAQGLATYFEATLEMSIKGNRAMYSKVQATQILKEFFNANHPNNLVEKHSGGKGNSQFSVFTLNTDTEKYRATVFYKGSGESARISQVTIEKDSGF